MSPQGPTAVIPSQSAAPGASYWDAPEEKKLKDKRLSKLSLSELGHVEYENENETEASPTTTEKATPAPAASYWDAPEEKKLKDKRLSKLSLSELGHVEYENETEPEANPTTAESPPTPAASGSYWDAPEEKKLKDKRLSKLSLSELGHVDYENENETAVNPTTTEKTPAPAASYWDAPEEKKLKDKRLSKLSLSELGHVEYENEAEAKPTTDNAATAASYWDAPPEQQLQGKTLSTLSLTGLGHTDHGNHEEPGADATKQAVPGEEPKSKEDGGGYWGWQENIKKTLSKLSLSELAHSSTTTTTATSPASSDTTGDDEDVGDKEIKRRPSTNSFWFWPNSSTSNLQDAKEEPNANGNNTKSVEENKAGVTIARRPSGAGGYWFWRNPSATNLTDGQKTDSTVSLETLEKNARASDRKEGKQGPITNLQHKMRSSWRASFKSFSSNTLTALDESTPNQQKSPSKTNVGEGWQGDFSEKEANTSLTRRDSFVVPEDDEDGMTF